MEPTKQDLEDPLFEAVWQVIKDWDISRNPEGQGYAGATGTDVMEIITKIRETQKEEASTY